MSKSIEQLRRDAKALRRDYEAGDRHAWTRVANFRPRPEGAALKHADFLHVVARENSFASWKHLKLAVETHGMDRAAKQQRLGVAIHYGQVWVVDRLLADTPDLADGNFALLCALYRQEAVQAWVAREPEIATRKHGMAPPLMHLARSRMLKHWPEREAAMLAIADLLLAQGADVNAGLPAYEGSDHMLSPLYFALGHADNMPLSRWLLQQGADPNDNESLYHATELGHHEGLRLLLTHGADPKGTNAMLRAIDFNDLGAVRMLLDAGALADEFDETPVGGEAPWVVPALHQAARRLCSREMIELLLEAGADPARRYQGMTPYAFARAFGNRDLVASLEARGLAEDLTGVEALLARIADGTRAEGEYVDPDKLPEACRHIIRDILHLPGTLPHIRRLVAAGVEFDRPDAEGLTPVQVAGWSGLPEVMGYFLSLSPDLGHVNGFGGTLLSTIIHGSENCPERAERDYLTCLRMALEQGVALPRRAVEVAGEEDVAEFLRDWAERYPGQVVEGGPG